MIKQVMIFGAGKIGRGFLGQLFHRSGYLLWFVDASPRLVSLMNREKKYRVDIATRPADSTEYIPLEGAFLPMEDPALISAFKNSDIIVTSVGARNIRPTAAFIGTLLRYREHSSPLNWLICENASDPAGQIREELLKLPDPGIRAFVKKRLGLVETQILRTGMNAHPAILEKEPLALRMHDWWTLPLDRDAFIGEIPDVSGFTPKPAFRNELVRKLYSFNATNGAISYIGWINGFTYLHEATAAYRDFFMKIQAEASHGLTGEYGFEKREQEEFMEMALNKYADPVLMDTIERNARDLARKLGPGERLAGPALLCLKHGRRPEALAIALAAAYSYTGSDDPSTRGVIAFLAEKGIEAALTKYSALEPGNTLFEMVVEAYDRQSYLFRT